jgi:photosystem II stability/assembly factor-like uncharacterized protein
MTEQINTTEDSLQEIVYGFAAAPGFHPGRAGVGFAAKMSGLYRTEDGGQTWQPAYASLGIHQALPTPAVLLTGYEEQPLVFAGLIGGLLRSPDGGLGWQSADLPAPPPAISCMVASPDFVNDGTLLAGTLEDGVLCSTDGGARWIAWNFGLLDLNVLCLAISPAFTADETLFAGCETGLFRSTNGGRAWREVNLPFGYEPVLSLAVSPSFDQDGTLFLGTESKGLFRSSDRGRNWQPAGEGRFHSAINHICLAPDFNSTPDILVLTAEAILLSRDGGNSWHTRFPAGDSLASAILAPLGLVPGSPALLGLVDGNILLSQI